MLLRENAMAGTIESSDIMVSLEPQGEGIEIELESTVEKQFGGEIRQVIADTLHQMGVQNAHIRAVDKGALNCVIRARVQTAVCRSSGERFEWGGGPS